MQEATSAMERVVIVEEPAATLATAAEKSADPQHLQSPPVATAPPTPPPKPAHLKPNVSKEGVVEMLRARGMTKTYKSVFLHIDGAQVQILKLNDKGEPMEEKVLEECNLAEGGGVKAEGEAFEITGPTIPSAWKFKAATAAEWVAIIQKGIDQAHDRHEATQKNMVRALIGDQTGSAKRNSKRTSILHSKRSSSAATAQAKSSQFSTGLKTVASFREFGGGADAEIVTAVGASKPPSRA
jgi:hypothetical protein